MFETIYPFLISLMIGLLIGIERERNDKKRHWVGGIRTFILFALLGTAVASMGRIYLTCLVTIFIFGLLSVSYYRITKLKSANTKGVGITTELAAAMVYLLGYMTPFEPKLSIFLSVIILVVLFERESLHKFSREKLTRKELQAAIVILIIALAILPLLPSKPIDPWQLINLQKICMLIAVLAIMQFGGYIALRIFGFRLGYLVMGFLGGLISSTALFATLARDSKQNNSENYSLLAAGLAAVAATLLETLVIICITASELAKTTAIPILTMVVLSTFIALILAKISPKGNVDLSQLPNPLDFNSVLKLALIIFVMYILVAITRQLAGLKATGLVTFLGGLFESHSVTLANAILFSQSKLTLLAASIFIYLAILSGFVSKFGLIMTIARNKFALRMSGLLSIILTLGSICYYLFLP
ncbi:MAG: hypothetical protein CMF49_01520 [Legionellales bacterium]|nr:hypothetical protein [Legionellales bacterium]|tara:strand:- start:1231 stop:2478 length:1248 start_codon:yes stop_codon:yes gene_type:complete